jgi:hypothetical protein
MDIKEQRQMSVEYTIPLCSCEREYELLVLRIVMDLRGKSDTFKHNVRSYIETGNPYVSYVIEEIEEVKYTVRKFYTEVCKRRVLMEKHI